MSNSSPTAIERIRLAAAVQAYANARQLGYNPAMAYREANIVAKFISETMAVEPTRVLYAPLLQRFCE